MSLPALYETDRLRVSAQLTKLTHLLRESGDDVTGSMVQ